MPDPPALEARRDPTSETESDVRAALLAAQQALRRAGAGPVIVLLVGPETAGRGETADLLNAWMDPRGIVTRAWAALSDEERERPPFWRYWRALPSRGQVGLFLSGWYGPPILERAERKLGKKRFDRRVRRIAGLERALADDGAVLVKCWLHVDRRTQAKRLAALAADPLRRWRAGKAQQRRLRLHRRIVGAWKRAAAVTGTEQAPWHVIDAAHEDHRRLHVAKQVLAGIEQALATSAQPEVAPRPAAPARPEPPVPTEAPAPTGTSPPPETPKRPEVPVPAEVPTQAEASPAAESSRPPEVPARPEVPTPEAPAPERARRITPPVEDHLGALDLTRSIDRERSRIELERHQGRLYRAQQRARERGVSTVVVFEGWDAGGKGGAIRRATAALDARYYRVIPIAAPTDEELAHHYLWRFWRHLSRAGEIVMFDRSWYGRVLVERVEGFAAPHEWRRAYDEIRQFEEQLVDHGIVLVKFWLHIGREEQLRRFRDREATPYKRWKITGEDWRNRERWDDYVAAVNEMVERTSTRRAPWTLVEGNDKRFARVQVVRTLADRLRRAARRA